MSQLTSFFQVTLWLIPLNGGHLYKPFKSVTTYGSKRVTPENAGLFAGGHLCALGMGTLEENTTSPGVGTLKNKHHTQKTFRFFWKCFIFYCGKEMYICRYRLFSVRYVGTSLKETREELVILATQTMHLCAEKINTDLIYRNIWRMHVEPTYLTWPW